MTQKSKLDKLGKKSTQPFEGELSVIKPDRTFFEYAEAFDKLVGKLANHPDLNGFLEWLGGTDFYDAPASSNYHCSYPGGLMVHSVHVAELLLYYTKANKLVWDSKESPILIGLFHDLCKVNLYKPEKKRVRTDRVDDYGNAIWEDGIYYTFEDQLPIGDHGDKSVMLLMDYFSMFPSEKMCIRWHMGRPSDFPASNTFRAAVRKCPNILWVNLADHMASVFEDAMPVPRHD